MRPPAACIPAILIGLAAGVAARWLTHGGSGATNQPRQVSATAAALPTASALPPAVEQLSPPEPRVSAADLLALRGWEQAEVFGVWIATASEADCRDLLLQLKEHDDGDDTTLKGAAFLRWMELDAAEAMSFAEKEGSYAGVAWWAWGKLDPERALAAAAEKKNAWHGKAALRGIAQTDPQRALELMARYPQFEDVTSLEGLASGLSRTDPRAAAEICLRLDTTESRNVFKGWAKREPDAALAWALDIKSPGQRSNLLKALMEQWQDTSPERIPAMLTALPAGSLKLDLLSSHAATLAHTDPVAALAFAKQIEAPGARTPAIGSALRSVAEDQPQTALEIIRTEPWDRSLAHGLHSAMQELAGSLPVETLTFLESKGAADEMAQGLQQGVFDTWTERDIGKASAWLAEQPAEQRREENVRTLVSVLVQEGPDRDFEAALQWSLSSTLREDDDHMDFTMGTWYRNDPDAALRASERPDFPPKVRESLLELHAQSTEP